MISNIQQSVDKKKYDENFDRIFRDKKIAVPGWKDKIDSVHYTPLPIHKGEDE